MMYLHRYLRLTPALAILICFSMILPLYLTSGPWAEVPEEGTCDRYWWYHILYINNFKIESLACVGHAWYLANDMQFFILSPLFLYAFKVFNHFPFICIHPLKIHVFFFLFDYVLCKTKSYVFGQVIHPFSINPVLTFVELLLFWNCCYCRTVCQPPTLLPLPSQM